MTQLTELTTHKCHTDNNSHHSTIIHTNSSVQHKGLCSLLLFLLLCGLHLPLVRLHLLLGSTSFSHVGCPHNCAIRNTFGKEQRLTQHLTQHVVILILEKWFPLQGERAHELIPCIFGVFKNREERQNNNRQTFTQVITFSTDYKYHLTLTFIIHNKYLSTLYIYIYIHT